MSLNKTKKTVVKRPAVKALDPVKDFVGDTPAVDLVAESLRGRKLSQRGPAPSWTVTEADVQAGVPSQDRA